jgi:hypothetical protein
VKYGVLASAVLNTSDKAGVHRICTNMSQYECEGREVCVSQVVELDDLSAKCQDC